MNELINILFSVFFDRLPSEEALRCYSNMDEFDLVTSLMLSKEYRSNEKIHMRSVRKLTDGERDFLNSRYSCDLSRLSTKEEFIERVLKQWLIYEAKAKGVEYIEFKSLPRSGHHFLHSLLDKYFSENIHYCERYAPENCCHQIPCLKPFNRPKSNKFMMQKSHDFRLVDYMYSGCKYIIQHRSITSRVQSNFELAINNPNSGWRDNKKDFFKFCYSELEETKGFYSKWILCEKNIDRCTVLYEDLVDESEKELKRIVEFLIEEKADDNRIMKAVAGKEKKVNTLNSPKGIRDPEEHRYFDRVLFRRLEQELADAFPMIANRYYFI